MSLPPPPGEPVDRRALTLRQREIASLVRDAHTSPEIARALGLSVTTVKRELAVIYVKLNVHNRVELAVRWDRDHPRSRS